MEPLVGSTVSHYKILRKLGRGGMGVVYEAEDIQLGRRVAVKFLSEEMQRDGAVLERFQREARAASALNHPGICTVHSIDHHERQHFIVMELLEGQSLAQRIGQPFALPDLLDLAIQIADALESAHSKGIVHRDLKPGNLFINSRGQVKVLDFGLAKMALAHQALAAGEPGSEVETTLKASDLTALGSVLGTAAYMSPEQARGQLTDARTDLFSLGTVLYQMATGAVPFQGDTEAVVFDSILNRDPRPASGVNPELPAAFERILEKALEKDRALRYQTATELKTDLLRLRRDLDSGRRRAVDLSDSRGGAERAAEKSIAVLYFENPSGAQEDEYLRDGITEDIITELSKIRGMQVFSRPTVLAYRDKQVTPAQIGQQLRAAYVLAGSLRRAGSRLRITTQLVDTRTDFPLWSERYDREMKDVFEVQDEIAHKIAEALRITLTPQEQAALAAKPTENMQAYDLYLRGRNYARRVGRQDLMFALQMFENAVALDPDFALAHAGLANVCAEYYYHFERQQQWLDRAISATQKVNTKAHDAPEIQLAEAWVLFAEGRYDDAAEKVRTALTRNPDVDGGYYLLGRALFSAGKYQEVVDMMEEALAHAGENYNTTIPIHNSLGALGKTEMVKNLRQRRMQALESHVRQVPEDARARILLSIDYASENRVDDAVREASLAMVLRPNEAVVLYNAACTFCCLNKKAEALDALEKAWRAGFKDANWARRDPDLALLHDDPEFERLYPEKSAATEATSP